MANSYEQRTTSGGGSAAKPAAPRRSSGNPVFIGCFILGVCILIAGINIGSSINKLNKTIAEQNFASSNVYNSPSAIAIKDKKYLNAKEAAEYLNVPDQKILELLGSGQITEYVLTDEGYSISIVKLDEWFANEAYQNMLQIRGLDAN